MPRLAPAGSSPTTPEVWPPSPPETETELERAIRLEEEKEAKRVSDEIDRAIEIDKQALRKRKHETRILLLGQAESGKSTLLKNFQLYFSPQAFQEETDAWRAVIYLNLIRSVNFILDLLSAGAGLGPLNSSPSVHSGSGVSRNTPMSPSSHTLRQLRMRLSPLRQVETSIVRRISGDNSRGILSAEEVAPWYYGRASEVVIRSGSGWKSMLRRKFQSRTTDVRTDELDNAKQVLEGCSEDIIMLWADPLIQAGLREEGVSLHEQSGFFLDQAGRITSNDYVPTTEDILRARLQTVGVEEHRLTVESTGITGQQWTFYDVGGIRGQRASWVPYFDDVNAVIFLCPMSAFNEVLLEDRTVNRLLDSFTLWKAICSSKLLTATTFILLLNKNDILEAKLRSGISFVQYVKSYKGPNDAEHISEYLKRKFHAINKHNSTRKRQLHVHVTCAIDVKIMSVVLVRIKDAILMENLMGSDYI